jgi:hypothetical protein
MNDKYAILVNTCDAYSDAWDMFLFILKKTWNSEFPRIYFNTENGKVVDNDIRITMLNTGGEKNIQWGDRLLSCLNKIGEEYVLMLLEDFYFEKPIRVDMIEKTIHYMNHNKNIAAFQFVPAGDCYKDNFKPYKTYYGGYARRKYDHNCLIAGPTMWRKSDLIKFTTKKDSPWEWEYFGSFRTWIYGKEIYCWFDKSDPIFAYDIVHGGAIHRGAWVGYKIKELGEKYNYSLDYGDRKVVYDWLKDEKPEYVPKYKRIKSIFRNRSKIFLSILYGFKLRIERSTKR